MKPCNLLAEPWIPVRRSSGEGSWIAPWQVTEAEDPPVSIDSGMPDFDGALIQFLIGLVQTGAAPDTGKEWRDRFDQPPNSETLRIDALDMSLMGSFAAGLITCLPQVPEVRAFAAPEIVGAEPGNVRAAQPMANPTQYFFYTPEITLLSQTAITAGGTRPEIAVDYLWFNGHPVATEEIQTNTTRFTFTDHLGTPFMQTDETATVTWRAEYEPFGAVYKMRAGHAADQRLRFPGQEYDEQTPERAYNIYRWYRPGRGAYSQADPIEATESTSTYSYALGSPTAVTDRKGLIPAGTMKCRRKPGDPSAREIFIVLYDPNGDSNTDMGATAKGRVQILSFGRPESVRPGVPCGVNYSGDYNSDKPGNEDPWRGLTEITNAKWSGFFTGRWRGREATSEEIPNMMKNRFEKWKNQKNCFGKNNQCSDFVDFMRYGSPPGPLVPPFTLSDSCE